MSNSSAKTGHLLTTIVALTVGGILATGILYFFLVAVPNAREAARRSSCCCNIKRLALGMHNYHEKYGSFPPAYMTDVRGKPIHGWRVLILPFIEEKLLYQQYRFDEPWNGPNNAKLIDQMPRIFRCPSRDDPSGATDYLAVVGPETMWPGERATKFGDIDDGTASTLMFVEVPDSGISWTEPRDLDFRQLAATLRSRTAHPQTWSNPQHPSGCWSVLANGQLHFIDNQTAAAKLEAMATIAGGETIEIPE